MKNQKEQDVALIAGEFAACDIGDKRRTMRLQAIATSLAREPGASLPKALPAVKEREGAYRLLENPAVDFQSIMQGHFSATRERVSSSSGRLLVLHDTTKAQFSTEREGLGQLRGK